MTPMCHEAENEKLINNFTNKMKLKFKIAKFFGLKYLANKNTKEIHNLSNPHPNCRIKYIRHYRLVGEKTMIKLMNDGYNGCRFCMKKWDKG